MAYEIGTATDHADLLTKLRTFLTSNTDLVNAGEAWTEVAHNPVDAANEETYLRGPGLSGTDEIFVNIRRYEDVSEDWYNWEIRGATNYDSGSSYFNQPGLSPQTHFTLIDTSIPYWFIANGRRFIVVAKVSTVYVAMHAGFLLPYATPSEYPYPLMVAGNTNLPRRWSEPTTGINNCFFNPGIEATFVRPVDGAWRSIENIEAGGGDNTSSRAHIAPYYLFRENPTQVDAPIYGFGNLYPLSSLILYDVENAGVVYGEIDGVYHVSGFSAASEDTIAISGTTHLITQSTFHTTQDQYAAFALE